MFTKKEGLMLSDIEIARRSRIKPIEEIARSLGINKKYLIPYGRHIAKIDLDFMAKLKKQKGKYILVTAITPTPLGEGKTVTTIGLSMALNKLNVKSCACIRQPSMGPVFGIKGGAAGGGYSQALPMEDLNLHFTGDTHAIGMANNLAASVLDNSVYKGNRLKIDPRTITWRRSIDINDRSLRQIKTGFGLGSAESVRETGFDITAASEVMAILALSLGIKDMHRRLKRIVLGYTRGLKPVTAEDLKVAGSMAVLLKDAIKPNLIQTLENTPCFVHAGPFGNIAQGTNSILADKIALGVCDYVVTEAGFGADCGAEKFFDIKCRTSGFRPDAAVLVCSTRALKAHSGNFKIKPGMPLDTCFSRQDMQALEKGLPNLKKQIENILAFGVPVVVVINRFACDTPKEINFVMQKAREFGAYDSCVSEVWSNGSRGGMELARAVVRAADEKSRFRFLYPLRMPLRDKIKRIATAMYGAKNVSYSALSEEKIELFTKLGYDNLPICMAKTHLSLSHNPHLLGSPKDFVLPVRDLKAYIGAGFISALCGNIRTMPGLPSNPASERITIDDKGNVKGLY